MVLLASGCASGASAKRTNGTTAPSTGSGTPASTTQSGPTVSLPADPCSLITLTALKQAVGDDFNAPTRTVADAGGVPVVSGAECVFDTGYGGGVIFIVFQDATDADAQSQFAHFKQFFPPAANGQLSGIGDEAYIDAQQSLHGRKDNIRYYIEIHDDTTLADDAATDTADQQLAVSVVPQI
ncbi:MAG: DUF3558 family protein [Ktedonobacterales bacterium]